VVSDIIFICCLLNAPEYAVIVIEQARSYRFTIKQIFKEHWENYLSRHKDSLSQDVIWTIEKMLSCRNPDKLGYHKYVCPDYPDEYIVVPHFCKTRFCKSCSKVLTDKWVERIKNDFPPTGFHHICFTVPQESRQVLGEYGFLLNYLLRTSSKTVLSWPKESHLLPAMVSSCRTSGRNPKFHPPIHMLMSSKGIDLKSKRLNRWKSSSFIPFKMLHKRYRFLLVKELKKTIRKHLEESLNPGKLSVFSYPGILDPSLTLCSR